MLFIFQILKMLKDWKWFLFEDTLWPIVKPWLDSLSCATKSQKFLLTLPRRSRKSYTLGQAVKYIIKTILENEPDIEITILITAIGYHAQNNLLAAIGVDEMSTNIKERVSFILTNVIVDRPIIVNKFVLHIVDDPYYCGPPLDIKSPYHTLTIATASDPFNKRYADILSRNVTRAEFEHNGKLCDKVREHYLLSLKYTARYLVRIRHKQIRRNLDIYIIRDLANIVMGFL